MNKTLPFKLSLILLLALLSLPAAAQSAFERNADRIKRATVFIYQTESRGNDLVVKCVSTGTLISAAGLIVTNAHSILPSRNCDGDSLIVAINVDLNEPPIPKYRAEIASADEGIDIALLQITRELDGRLIAEGTLPALPFVDIGDSDSIAIDENVAVVGYLDLGNQAVAIRRGTITAFIAEPRGGGRAWFKTRAEIPGAMSGGGAYSADGQLIGIPTHAPFGLLGSDSNCRLIEDTNQDGLINSNDSCVPTGDFISAIRPIRLAQSLIRGAALGLEVELETVPATRPNPIDPPRLSRLFFSPSVINGRPSTVVGAMPANTNSLYLFFDYDNMSPETVYEMRVMRDGIPDAVFSLPPVRWSGGRQGLWYIGSRGQPWANGAYEFTLLVNGLAKGSQQIVIGGAADRSPAFSDIVFGLLDLRGNLLGNGSILSTGSIASARFVYANMENGIPWTAIWYFNHSEVARSEELWSFGKNGSNVVNLRPQGGLLPGAYRLELYVQGALSATSDFTVAGAPASPLPAIFTNARYSSAPTAFEALTAPAMATFPDSIPTLFALFDWQQIAAGTPWSVRWLVDDRAFYEAAWDWVTVETGTNFLMSLRNPPDGSYRLQVFVSGLQVLEIVATVGIGQLPIDRFAETDGAIFGGRVIDAATQSGIPSVTIILISEDYSVSDFEWKQEQITALAATDRNGDFQFDRPLSFGAQYSVIIEAEGYIPLTADGFEFSQNERMVSSVIELVRG